MRVLATAGHVDHGKSALVRALTGMEPDRYEEERRRGLTLDLGFVWTRLGGDHLAFVDVPGHERFVPTMLAGAGPVPAVLFVVAADQGWQPQSAEHLAVLDALGVRHAVLAVTRSDLADPEPVRADAVERLAGTSLGTVPQVAVSAVTGAGLDELRAALSRLAATLPAPDPDADVRLWLDRAFTVRGHGTVVTGTLGAGTLRVGDRLVTADGSAVLRVRGLQEPARGADGRRRGGPCRRQGARSGRRRPVQGAGAAHPRPLAVHRGRRRTDRRGADGRGAPVRRPAHRDGRRPGDRAPPRPGHRPAHAPPGAAPAGR
ncbi:GTP-binding protein [Streptomyces tricolor]|nr:GTP-binding protein [Streptomyces tricolor]